MLAMASLPSAGVGVPGPAIVAPWVVSRSKYPAGQGYDAVESILKEARQFGGSRFRAPAGQSTAYKKVDIPSTGMEEDGFKQYMNRIWS